MQKHHHITPYQIAIVSNMWDANMCDANMCDAIFARIQQITELIQHITESMHQQQLSGENVAAAVAVMREKIAELICERDKQEALLHERRALLCTQEALKHAYNNIFHCITYDNMNYMSKTVLKFPMKGCFDKRIEYAHKLLVIQCRIHATPLVGDIFNRSTISRNSIDTRDLMTTNTGRRTYISNESPLYGVLCFYSNRQIANRYPTFSKMIADAFCIYRDIKRECKRREDALNAIFVSLYERMWNEYANIDKRLERVKHNAKNNKITVAMIYDFASNIDKIFEGYVKEYHEEYARAHNSEIYRWVIEDPIL